MKNEYHNTSTGRRKFLNSVTGLVGTSLVMSLPGINFAETTKQTYTVKQVVDSILKEIPNAPFPKTVDTLKSGSMEQVVTGIVTTMFPTIAVIEEAAKKGANLIIPHEPLFYNNQDETEWLQDDEVFQYKIGLLKKHNMAVWRFHDYWHAHRPDGIIMGNLIKLGWEKYFDPNNPRLLTLPVPMTINEIAAFTKDKLGISTIRVVGDLNQKVRKIYMAFGYMDGTMQVKAITQHQPDLILSGETREWEAVERVRDGLLMGKSTSLMVLSHAVSEEAGMEYAAAWLAPKVPGLKVIHIPSTNPFTFI